MKHTLGMAAVAAVVLLSSVSTRAAVTARIEPGDGAAIAFGTTTALTRPNPAGGRADDSDSKKADIGESAMFSVALPEVKASLLGMPWENPILDFAGVGAEMTGDGSKNDEETAVTYRFSARELGAPPPVPEPSSALLGLAAAVIFFLRHQRRRRCATAGMAPVLETWDL